MTVSKSPNYKAKKRIQREFGRYNRKEITLEQYQMRVASIKEFYEID